MKIFNNISIIDSVDSSCSTLGNEFIYEKGNKTNLILPCFNIGFYENAINNESITKAVDICYFLFESISKCEIQLSKYENIHPNDKRTIDLDGNKFYYEYNFEKSFIDVNSFYIEGTCLRGNSFSYGSYRIFAESTKVILTEESKISDIYTTNDDYKSNFYYHSFLLNLNKEYENVEQIKKSF